MPLASLPSRSVLPAVSWRTTRNPASSRNRFAVAREEEGVVEHVVTVTAAHDPGCDSVDDRDLHRENTVFPHDGVNLPEGRLGLQEVLHDVEHGHDSDGPGWEPGIGKQVLPDLEAELLSCIASCPRIRFDAQRLEPARTGLGQEVTGHRTDVEQWTSRTELPQTVDYRLEVGDLVSLLLEEDVQERDRSLASDRRPRREPALSRVSQTAPQAVDHATAVGVVVDELVGSRTAERALVEDDGHPVSGGRRVEPRRSRHLGFGHAHRSDLRCLRSTSRLQSRVRRCRPSRSSP